MEKDQSILFNSYKNDRLYLSSLSLASSPACSLIFQIRGRPRFKSFLLLVRKTGTKIKAVRRTKKIKCTQDYDISRSEDYQ